MQQEAADELVGRQGHGPVALAPVAAVVLDVEGHARVGRGDQPAVRDGDAVGVAAEVGEHRLRAGEGRLGVDEPVLPAQRREMAPKAPASFRRARSPKKASRPAAWAAARPSSMSRRNRRESTRTGRRKPGRQRIQLAPSRAMPPPGTIMWMCGWWVIAEPQVCSTAVMPMRAPRCLRIGGDGQQRLGGGPEQEVVDHGLVLVGDGGDLGRQREDHVEVRHRQQVRLAGGEPVPRCRPWHFGQWRLRQEL